MRGIGGEGHERALGIGVDGKVGVARRAPDPIRGKIVSMNAASGAGDDS